MFIRMLTWSCLALRQRWQWTSNKFSLSRASATRSTPFSSHDCSEHSKICLLSHHSKSSVKYRKISSLFTKSQHACTLFFSSSLLIFSVKVQSSGSELTDDSTPLTCYYHLFNCMMKLEVNDPTIRYTIHSPYDVVTAESVFTEIGPTEELEHTYTVAETTWVRQWSADLSCNSIVPHVWVGEGVKFSGEKDEKFKFSLVNVWFFHHHFAVQMKRSNRSHFTSGNVSSTMKHSWTVSLATTWTFADWSVALRLHFSCAIVARIFTNSLVSRFHIALLLLLNVIAI